MLKIAVRLNESGENFSSRVHMNLGVQIATHGAQNHWECIFPFSLWFSVLNVGWVSEWASEWVNEITENVSGNPTFYVYKAIKSLAFVSFRFSLILIWIRFVLFFSCSLFLGSVCSKWQIVKCAEMWKKCLFKKGQEARGRRRRKENGRETA